MSSDHTNRTVLLWASFFTLVAAGMGFGVRAGVLQLFGADFGFTQTELGQITGGGLVGFGAVILLASLFVDKFGYKPFLLLAFILHVVSLITILSANMAFASMGKDGAFWCLYIGWFIFAVANGICEAVINPLVATLYPRNKTHYLNILHAGWPGGLILGGLVSYLWGSALSWEIQISFFLIPTAVYGVMVLSQKFPMSEARAAGVTFGTMLKEFTMPILLFLFVLHALVGYVELGTDSWIGNITGAIMADPAKGMMLFVYTSALMFVLRFFAGPIVHRISPLGLLCVSAVIGFIGLQLLGGAQTVTMCVIAATIYALGKTFLWPTMLGVVGERFPRGGALTMGAIGGIGMLSAGLLGGPGIGYKQDYYASNQLQAEAPEAYERYKSESPNSFLFFPEITGLDGAKVPVVLDKGAALNSEVEVLQESGRSLDEVPALQSLNTWWQDTAQAHADEDQAPVSEARLHGGRQALKVTSYIPLAMAIGYLLLILYFRTQGGYKAIHLTEEGTEEKIDVATGEVKDEEKIE